jgi:hypothetical protein
MQDHVMSDPATIRQFTLAGLATLTLKSLRTNKHYTYKIKQSEDRATGEKQALWFVYVLANGDEYLYAGVLNNQEAFKLTAKSRFSEGAESIMAFRYFWAGIQAGQIKPQLEIRHEGRCGRCGRELTTPESVDTGFGPDCAEMLGIEWAVRTAPAPAAEANGYAETSWGQPI